MRLILTIFLVLMSLSMSIVLGIVSLAYAQEETQSISSVAQEQKFITAARNGNLQEITELIASGIKVNVTDVNTGRNALHEAASRAHLGVIEVLLANDREIIDQQDESGYTALHIAVDKRHLSVVTSLVDKGADINIALANGESPLHTALRKNYIPIVRYLMGKNAVISVDNKGLTPLHYAVSGGYIDIAEQILALEAEIELPDQLGNTPLHYAAMSGQLDMTAFLLLKGADPYVRNGKQQTPSILASGNGHPRVLSLIRIYQNDPSLAKVVFRSNVTPDFSGWRDSLPARIADGANQNALPQLQDMVTQISERYLSLVDITIPRLIERPQLPAPLDVRQTLFESDYEFDFRVNNEVGEYRNIFYRLQQTFGQDVNSRNARISSLRERVALRRSNLDKMLPLFKRDALYEIMRSFRLEDPLFNARTGELSFLLTATGAVYQQRIAIQPHDADIVEKLYTAPQNADVSVTLIIEADYIVLGDVYIEYDEEIIFKAELVTIDADGNTISRGSALTINGDAIGNKVEQALTLDSVFQQQDPDLVVNATIANVRYSDNRGVPIIYNDNVAEVLNELSDDDVDARLDNDEESDILTDDIVASSEL